MLAIVIPSAMARSQRASLSEIDSGTSAPARSASWRAIRHGSTVVPDGQRGADGRHDLLGFGVPRHGAREAEPKRAAVARDSRVFEEGDDRRGRRLHEHGQLRPRVLAVDGEGDGVRALHALVEGGVRLDCEAALGERGREAAAIRR